MIDNHANQKSTQSHNTKLLLSITSGIIFIAIAIIAIVILINNVNNTNNNNKPNRQSILQSNDAKFVVSANLIPTTDENGIINESSPIALYYIYFYNDDNLVTKLQNCYEFKTNSAAEKYYNNYIRFDTIDESQAKLHDNLFIITIDRDQYEGLNIDQIKQSNTAYDINSNPIPLEVINDSSSNTPDNTNEPTKAN